MQQQQRASFSLRVESVDQSFELNVCYIRTYFKQMERHRSPGIRIWTEVLDSKKFKIKWKKGIGTQICTKIPLTQAFALSAFFKASMDTSVNSSFSPGPGQHFISLMWNRQSLWLTLRGTVVLTRLRDYKSKTQCSETANHAYIQSHRIESSTLININGQYIRNTSGNN